LVKDERQALRAVNHALRRAMNAAVSRVACAEATFAAPDLLNVFPNVVSLDLNLSNTTHVCELLERMVNGKASMSASSQAGRLLNQLHSCQRFRRC
jgi:hypothetical protein